MAAAVRRPRLATAAVLLALAAAGASPPAGAQQRRCAGPPIAAPFVALDAGTAVVQLAGRHVDGAADRHRDDLGPLVLRAGVARGLELQAGVRPRVRDARDGTVTDGFGGAELGVRWQLLRPGADGPRWIPRTALTASWLTPAGGPAAVAGPEAIDLRAAANWRVVPGLLALVGTAGWTRPLGDDLTRTTVAGTLMAQLHPRLKGIADVTRQQVGSRPSPEVVRLGGILTLRPGLELDVRAGASIGAGPVTRQAAVLLATRW